ncbi:MAG: hypothetical protein H7343_17755 [Undibacterium sp.]|nr:hypothetical protein [Opitutaceae bacterium]
MKFHQFAPVLSAAFFGSVLLCSVALITTPAAAASKKKNPSSKLYVADLNGEAQIDTGEKIDDLAKKSVYNAQGTVIETKSKSNNAMVFSNGTGGYFDEDTRVEIKTFAQEPFTPNRTDMDVEPSISQTRAFVARGSVGLCTSKLVAGSNMTYNTAQGSVNIRGKRIVIAAGDRETKISMIEGDSTVKGGDLDLGGQTLKAGEQAIIRNGAPGQPSSVSIQKIPENERQALDEKVTLACMAKKTVYFEVREKVINEGQAAGEPAAASDSVNAFDAPDGNASRKSPINIISPGSTSGPNVPVVTTVTEIVPVEVVPQAPPTNNPVSTSRLPG